MRPRKAKSLRFPPQVNRKDWDLDLVGAGARTPFGPAPCGRSPPGRTALDLTDVNRAHLTIPQSLHQAQVILKVGVEVASSEIPGRESVPPKISTKASWALSRSL